MARYVELPWYMRLCARPSAAKLYLSTATVRTHVHRTMTKLHARDRAQLVVIAYQTGLIRPAPAP